MSSIDQTLEHLKQTISQEQEAGRINSMASLATSKHRRAAITRDWQAIQAALLPIQQAIKALPDLPAEEPMKWAQNLLKMSSCLVLEVDTTGLDEEAEICRVTFATINGSLFDDILIRPSLGQIPAAAAAVNGITSEQIAHAPSLPDVWSRIREGFEGRYIVSFAQAWDSQVLARAAQHYHLPPLFFLGEDLARRLTQYYQKTYGIKLADIAERMTGKPLPMPATAIDRVKAQCAIISGMAEARTDVRPPKPVAEVSSGETDFLTIEGDIPGDLDEQPF